ncbi:hypothetical protein GCM10025794_38050 [Massilia kyonggiensis]
MAFSSPTNGHSKVMRKGMADPLRYDYERTDVLLPTSTVDPRRQE